MARKSSRKTSGQTTIALPIAAPHDNQAATPNTLDIINDVYRFLTDFATTLEAFPSKVGQNVMGILETPLAKRAAELHDLLVKVVPNTECVLADLPERPKRAFQVSKRIFMGWLDQWGYLPFAGPDRDTYFQERIELYTREILTPYCQAMLDWFEAIPPDDETWDSPAYRGAEEARRRGLKPTPGATLEEARARDEQLNERRFSDPALGKEVPSFTADEMQRFRAAVKVIADYVGGENWKRLPGALRRTPGARTGSGGCVVRRRDGCCLCQESEGDVADGLSG